MSIHTPETRHETIEALRTQVQALEFETQTLRTKIAESDGKLVGYGETVALAIKLRVALAKIRRGDSNPCGIAWEALQ